MSRIIITIICLVLAAFAVYREYQRDNKARLAWRVMASLVAVLALTFIISPISYLTTVTKSSEIGKVLLTQGFSKDSLPKNDSIFILDKSIHQQYPKAKLLDNADGLFSDSTRLNPVHIYGYGLNESDLKQLANKPVSFHPSPIPDGFTAVSWAQQIKSGRQFSVQGTYKNTSANAIKLLLEGLNTVLDSVMIPVGSQHEFTLTTTPKNSGRTVYSLLALSEKDTLQNEQLPVIIEPNQPIKVLILSASPDFETKFLKEWLGNNGYGVAARSNVTKGKLGQNYVNMEQIDLSHITSSLLSKFDMVVGDISVLKGLSTVENLVLQNEVAQKGLGIIIRADSSGKASSWLQSNFPVNHQGGMQSSPSALTIQGGGKTVALNIDPDFITPQNNTQVLVSDQHNQIQVNMAMDGAGKLIFTTIHNSYSWMLAGNQKDYSALWSMLMGKAIRRSTVAETWLVKTSLPSVGQPVELMAESASPLTNISINKTMIYPAQDAAMPFRQCFTYWPPAYGWQQVTSGKVADFWWYVWPKRAWRSIYASKTEALTQQYINANRAEVAASNHPAQKTNADVPKIYFYILFLMAATFLWVERKFYTS